jgi:site-specific DNA-methyltransferase (adenine-specific)|nr:MAG: DNA methylase [Bacteriophage sp.]
MPLTLQYVTRLMGWVLMGKRNVSARTQSTTASSMTKRIGINYPPPEYFTELQRVSKNQIIWGANYFVKYLSKGTKGWICWFKGQTGLTMSDCELAYSSFDCPTRVVTINRCELAKQQTIHPTEKPIKLYGWLLMNYAKPGDRILDTHLGSGSICIAAHDLGFEMLGIELDPGYFNAAKQRLLYHQAQLKLF